MLADYGGTVPHPLHKELHPLSTLWDHLSLRNTQPPRQRSRLRVCRWTRWRRGGSCPDHPQNIGKTRQQTLHRNTHPLAPSYTGLFGDIWQTAEHLPLSPKLVRIPPIPRHRSVCLADAVAAAVHACMHCMIQCRRIREITHMCRSSVISHPDPAAPQSEENEFMSGVGRTGARQ